MSNVFVIIKMCYVRNKWYDISCATLYNVTVVHQYSRSLFSEDCTPPPFQTPSWHVIQQPLHITYYQEVWTRVLTRGILTTSCGIKIEYMAINHDKHLPLVMQEDVLNNCLCQTHSPSRVLSCFLASHMFGYYLHSSVLSYGPFRLLHHYVFQEVSRGNM